MCISHKILKEDPIGSQIRLKSTKHVKTYAFTL